MRNNLTLEQLEQTETYKKLISKKENAQAKLISTRLERAKILNAYLVYKNKGVIPTTVIGNNRLIVLDLIKSDEEINRLNP
jgi:hypothetical protein